jgi:hypothetical protein
MVVHQTPTEIQEVANLWTQELVAEDWAELLQRAGHQVRFSFVHGKLV